MSKIQTGVKIFNNTNVLEKSKIVNWMLLIKIYSSALVTLCNGHKKKVRCSFCMVIKLMYFKCVKFKNSLHIKNKETI